MILGVDDDRHRGYLPQCRKRPAQGLHQELLAGTFATKAPVDREPADEGCWDEGILGSFLATSSGHAPASTLSAESV